MLELNEISRVARHATIATLHVADVRVDSKVIADSNGDEAVRVILILDKAEISQIDGDSALDVTANIHNDLQNFGENRLAIIEFATEDELEMTDDE